MSFYNEQHDINFWHQSGFDIRAFNEQYQLILLETIENADPESDLPSKIQELLYWLDVTYEKRFMHWLKSLNDVKKINKQTYTKIVKAIIWAFSKQKAIVVQTQHQCEISIAIIKKILFFDIRIYHTDDAKYLLMNLFILSERPDLCKISLHKQMLLYKNGELNNIFNNNYSRLLNNIFVQKSIPSFLFPYLINCSHLEYQIIIQLLDGKSLRKILPENLKISKSENAILQSNIIEFHDIENDFLERYILAARILKEAPKESEMLSLMLNFSSVFMDQLATFKRDLDFWKSVFRFLYKNKNKLTLENNFLVPHYIDFFQSKRYFCEAPLKYSLKGRTFESVERAIGEWQFFDDISLSYLENTWEPLPIKQWLYMDDTFSYIIEEITEGNRLLEESNTLHHCVFSYVESCMNGSIHIFSLSLLKDNIKKPFYTIEVRDLEITQIAGEMNEKPSDKVMKIIKEWCKVNNIDIKLWIE